MRNWDYNTNAAYFVTICTQNKKCYFGEIAEPEDIGSLPQMQLSETGQLAHKLWQEIPNHFPFVLLQNFVTMPNHVHGIIVINHQDNSDNSVETLHATSLQTLPPDKNKFMSGISLKSGTLSTIIRSYKSAVTKNARPILPNFGWQSRFHDHIIRDDKSLDRISDYIQNNPAKWFEDKYYQFKPD